MLGIFGVQILAVHSDLCSRQISFFLRCFVALLFRCSVGWLVGFCLLIDWLKVHFLASFIG